MKFPSLTIWQKLSLVILLMALPATPLMYFYFESRNEQILATEAELSGLEYLAELRQLLDALTVHRDATQVQLAGDPSFRNTVESARPHIIAALGAIDRIDSRAGAKWETTAKWYTIKAAWNSLIGQNLSPQESFQRHTTLITQVLQLMRNVSDKSSLTTDPMLETFYLLDTLITGITPAIENLSQIRGLASANFARGTVVPEDNAQLSFLMRQLQVNSHDVERSLSNLDRNNPDASKLMSAGWKSASRLTEDMLSGVRFDGFRIGPGVARNFYEKSSRALSEYYALYDSGRTTVSALLTKRVETLQRQKLLQMAIVMVALAVAAFMVLSISRGIAKQTNAISRLFAEISAGNLNARASVFSNDELGQIAQELNFMLDDILQLIESREEKERIQANIVKLLDEVSGVAAGDLTRDAEVTSDVTGAIADSFNYMLAELRQIIASVQSTTAAVTGSATEVQHTASQLAYGSKAQSQALVDASAAIADMAKSIQQVSQSAGRAAHIAERALEDAKGGAATVGRTINGMNAIRGRVQETSKRIKRLGESSQEIGEIVRLIGDIADRTSILALNASIQASTAGEAGKGFAVVAEEVERLAVRAAESAKKISAIIKSVQSDTTEAVAAMEETTREVVNGSQLANEAGQRLRDIEGVSQQIAELIAQISDASRKQAAGSEEVSRNVTGISQFTQQTASGAQLTEASTRKLADLALELNASISRFKLPEGA